jgi:hypothetical protein
MQDSTPRPNHRVKIELTLPVPQRGSLCSLRRGIALAAFGRQSACRAPRADSAPLLALGESAERGGPGAPVMTPLGEQRRIGPTRCDGPPRSTRRYRPWTLRPRTIPCDHDPPIVIDGSPITWRLRDIRSHDHAPARVRSRSRLPILISANSRCDAYARSLLGLHRKHRLRALQQHLLGDAAQ